MRLVRKPSDPTDPKKQPTYSDSLALYNNALETQKFYDNLSKYYYPIREVPISSNQITYIERGRVEEDTKKTLEKALDRPGNTPEQIEDIQAAIDQIESNKDPDIHLINDLVTGAIDPRAPFVAYRTGIDPQSKRTYIPRNAFDDFVEGTNIYSRPKEAYSAAVHLKNLADDPSYIDNSDELKELLAKSGMSEKELIDKAIELKDFEEEISVNVPGYHTSIPYYDPIMVKPWDYLTPEEKNERIEKSVKSGNTGGIPQSVVDSINSGNPPKYSGQQQDLRKPMQFMTPLSASEISQDISRSLVPPSINDVQAQRQPRPIMKSDPSVSKGQYQVGEYIWDSEKNKWQERMWDKEDQKASRELSTPRQEKWRLIKAPKF